MAESQLGKADRFIKNPILRDQEWERAKQPPWWVTVLFLAIIGTGFFYAMYKGEAFGWVVAIVTIAVYVADSWLRRRRARRLLRETHAHGQAAL